MRARAGGIDAPAFADRAQERRWWVARRAALDHLLRASATGPSGDAMVLRGSMALTAWLGTAAREPGDLDWVSPTWVRTVDPLAPHPFAARAAVQQWTVALDGAAADDLWRDEEFDTRGVRACPPPEGLRWAFDDWDEPTDFPDDELLTALRAKPDAGGGVVLDPDDARRDGSWMYREYETPGVRLLIPWHADGVPDGEVRVDFAFDEALPASPVWTAVPRGDAGPPTVVSAASPALSLAWKLLWLSTDAADGEVLGKDLYDAVLLAESDRTRLRPALLARVLGGRRLGSAEIAAWPLDWDRFRAEHPAAHGTRGEWLGRLVRALEPVLASGPSRRPGPDQMS